MSMSIEDAGQWYCKSFGGRWFSWNFARLGCSHRLPVAPDSRGEYCRCAGKHKWFEEQLPATPKRALDPGIQTADTAQNQNKS
jgi:hypothetical protein